MIFKLVVHSAQTVHLSCIKISTISKETETSNHLSLVTQKYHRVHPKMISELRLAQTVQLSSTDSNSVSKWIETRFDMTNVTEEIHRVHPKRFLSLFYVRRKPCTYLASKLALCLNK
jgi:hypothetical protein